MRKLLALLLTLAMVLSLASVAVVATEEPVGTPVSTVQGLRDMTAAGGPYYLADDITIEDGEAQLVFKPGIVLDGNGHAILIADDYTWTATEPFFFEQIIDTEDEDGDGNVTETVHYPTPTVLKNLTFGKADDKIALPGVGTNDAGTYPTPLFSLGSSKYKVDWIDVDFYVTKDSSSSSITHDFAVFWNCNGVQNFTRCEIDANIVAKGQSTAFIFNGDGTLTFTECVLKGSLSGGSQAGGFVKASNGTLTFNNCDVEATIAGTSIVGAYVGLSGNATSNGSTTFNNCDMSGTVNAGSASPAGGYIGKLENTAAFDGCTMSGTVTAGSWGGGFIGGVYLAGSALSMTNCHLTGTHNAKDHVGGFVGGIDSTAAPTAENPFTFTNCSVASTGIVNQTSGGGYAGGFIGNTGRSYITFDNCENAGTLNFMRWAGGIIGRIASDGGTTNGLFVLTNCKNTGTINAILRNGSAACEGIGGLIGSNMNAGTTTVQIIGGGNFADINATNATGVAAIMCRSDDVALIKNVINTGNLTTSKQYIGGFVFNASNAHGLTIENCANYGNVTTTAGNGHAGGFVAYSDADGVVTLTNAVNYGTITSGQYAGGIAAQLTNATLSGCMNFGDVYGGHTAGGVIAQLAKAATLTNCLNAGAVSEKAGSTAESTAGIIGRIATVTNAVTLNYCVNVGTVTGTTKATTSYGAFTQQFGQFVGRVTSGMGNDPFQADDTAVAGIDWIDTGAISASLITLNNCYGFGVAQVGNTEIAESEYVLANFTPKNGDVAAFYTYTPEADAETNDTKPTVPNNGAYGNNVKLADGSTYTMLSDAAANAEALNALKLFPVTFTSDGNAVVVDEAPALKGYQQTADKKTIRFAAVLNDLTDVETAGFTYTVRVNGVTKIDNVSKNVNQVLYSVNQTNEGVTSKVLAANNGGQYFYTLTFVNVPLNATVEFTVQATLNGEAVGEAVTLTFVNGEYQAPQA